MGMKNANTFLKMDDVSNVFGTEKYLTMYKSSKKII